MASAGRLAGKVAVITASTDGIGLALAQHLGKAGASIVISSRRQKNVDKALERLGHVIGHNVKGTVCHVAKSEDRKNLLDFAVTSFGGIDLLISNAAISPYFGPMLQTNEEQWDKVFDTNVKSTFFLIQDTVPYMEQRGGGSIVTISSVAAYNPMPMIGAYSVSKTSLLGLTKALVPELSARNIRINGVAPGIVKTRFSGALWRDDAIASEALKQVPIGRFAGSDDIGGAVEFLCSDDASYVTGETICVAGGMTSKL